MPKPPAKYYERKRKREEAKQGTHLPVTISDMYRLEEQDLEGEFLLSCVNCDRDVTLKKSETPSKALRRAKKEGWVQIDEDYQGCLFTHLGNCPRCKKNRRL